MTSLHGWIRLHRKILENPLVCRDSDYFSVWVYLLLHATHTEYSTIFNGQRIMLKPGQLITGRKSIADFFRINESKVKRILTAFENDQQIDRVRSNKNSLISIVNWEKYQCFDQQYDQQVTSKRPANDQQMTTYNNIDKGIKEERKDNMSSPTSGDRPAYPYEDIIAYLNQKAGTHYRHTSEDSRKHIRARFLDGYTVEDFRTVIDKKVQEWKGTEQERYLRPATLFGTKFESYLNQRIVSGGGAKPTGFSNFQQRDYDMDELERQLLEAQNISGGVFRE